MYRITLSEQARKEYLYFTQSGNKAILNKIKNLLEDMAAHPYTGIGKPEPLKYELTGKWSRRINSEHRIVYSVHDDTVVLSKILCKWKQDSVVSFFLYLDSVFKNSDKLIHNQFPVMNRLCPFLFNFHK